MLVTPYIWDAKGAFGMPQQEHCCVLRLRCLDAWGCCQNTPCFWNLFKLMGYAFWICFNMLFLSCSFRSSDHVDFSCWEFLNLRSLLPACPRVFARHPYWKTGKLGAQMMVAWPFAPCHGCSKHWKNWASSGRLFKNGARMLLEAPGLTTRNKR